MRLHGPFFVGVNICFQNHSSKRFIPMKIQYKTY
ncbi:Uncharacterised protein [Comamonas testosteroni]|uniref:Uncharacterized protein n=1 Tax=Comamonas testosteroni TaxID=285 RepID=A0A8B4S2U8_COMTE|nr:hypothetical protein DFO48_106110 [Comamonas sp. AG1104]SUY76505.1 Uncharacterised protein [Comamonas testosteroni]